MSTVSPRGRSAHTDWRIRERFENFTLLELDLKTGRTHQLRVHCHALHHPIVGDKVYRPRKLEKTIARNRKRPDAILRLLKSVKRQMLHAWRLGFTHPQNDRWLSFESALPEDMVQVIQKIREAGL